MAVMNVQQVEHESFLCLLCPQPLRLSPHPPSTCILALSSSHHFLPSPSSVKLSNCSTSSHLSSFTALQHYSRSLSLIPRNTFSVPTQHVSQPANLRGRTELRQHLLPNSSSIYLTPSDAWSRALEVCEVLPRPVQLADLPQRPAVLPYLQQ